MKTEAGCSVKTGNQPRAFSQNPVPEKPLRLGIIGTGKISVNLLDAARKTPGVLPISLYSRTEENGERFAKAEGIPSRTSDFSAFLADPSLDAVYIASPNASHAAQAICALRAGKHVLCEKPIASNGAELAAMQAAARESGCVLLEAMRPLHDPALPLIKQYLPSLGTLRRVDLEYCQYSSRYDRFKSGIHTNTFDPTLSNAALMDIGVYAVAVLVALFGMPERVISSSLFLPGGFEGAGSAICSYPTMQASLAYSKIADSVCPSVICGEEGSITVDRLSGTRRIMFCPRGGEARELPYEPGENNMVWELADFRDLVRGMPPRAPFARWSEETMALLDQIRMQNGIRFPADR